MDVLRFVMAAVLVVGCNKNPSPEAEETKYRTQLEKELVDPKHQGPGTSIKPEPLRAAATTPGAAYLRLTNGGLIKLDGDGAMVVEPPEPIEQFATNRTTGELYARSATAVYKVSGATFERVAAAEPASYERLAIAPDGRVWLVAPSGPRYWTGTEWKTTGTLFPDDTQRVESVAIDGKNRVYVASDAMIMVSDQDTWKTVLDLRGVEIQGLYPSPSWLELVIAPAGELHAVIHNGLIKFDGKTVTTQLRPRTRDNFSRDAALHGTTLVSFSKDRIVRWTLPDGEDLVTTNSALPFGEKQVMDANGRVWGAVSEGGFSVVDDKGVVTHYPPGSFAEITSVVSKIAVAGGGPTLPKVVAIATGAIRGVIYRKGAAVPNAKIEVCQFLHGTYDKDSTPCWKQRVYKTNTDGTGTFEVKDLPLLDYGVAVGVGDRWYGIRGKACKGLVSGAVCDLGELQINEVEPESP